MSLASDSLSWMNQAACKGMTELFFPARGESTRPPKAVCASCPVRVECRAYGMDERFGIFGGLSERQRRRLKRGEDERHVRLMTVCGACGEPFDQPRPSGHPLMYCSDVCRRVIRRDAMRRSRAS